MSYQRFFGRYEKLAGMTGTAETEASEFWEIYNRITSYNVCYTKLLRSTSRRARCIRT